MVTKSNEQDELARDHKRKHPMLRKLVWLAVLVAVCFLGWRFIRPMNIFIVSAAFERPIDTGVAAGPFSNLRAEACAVCHRTIFDEWSTSIHSQAWTDPYFQVDWKFDRYQQICKNCHIPLDRQQEHKVVGFQDKDKWRPILTPNPQFDAGLQQEGVTCNACHFANGKVVGVLGNTNAPHPVEKIANANQVCIKCHVVSGERWDTFFRFPPCGTVAEIHTARGKTLVQESRDMHVDEIAALGCVDCHMPLVQRSLVSGGPVRTVRRHVWRGGHDPAMVKKGLTMSLQKTAGKDTNRFTLVITNTGAAHYIPTGTPDRHLTVQLRVLDKHGNILQEEKHILKRTVMWRPFIVDLWDNRLPRGQPREYTIAVSTKQTNAAVVEAQVHYHLLDEARRIRIGYENDTPIHYAVYQQTIPAF